MEICLQTHTDPHTPTWSTRLQRSIVDSLTMLPLIVNMMPNISLNYAVDMHPDVGCNVSNIALNLSVGKILQVWTHLEAIKVMFC